MMKYKTYVAESLEKAMFKIAVDLGKDALLVSHRDIRKGGVFGLFGKKMVEVTAALPVTSKPKPKPQKEELVQEISKEVVQPQIQPQLQLQAQPQPQIQQSYSQPQVQQAFEYAPQYQQYIPQPTVDSQIITMIQKELAEIKGKMTSLAMAGNNIKMFPGKSQEAYQRLINNDVDKELAEEIIKRVVLEAPPNILEDGVFIEGMVTKHIASLLKVDGPVELDDKGPKIIALIGPTGVGKTTTLAKIAADFAFEKRKDVSVVTVDTYRIAAAEQLKTYTDIIGVPLEVAYFPGEFKKAIEMHFNADIILIDTAGRSQRNSIQMAELKAFIDQTGLRIENYLLLSATTKYKELLDIVENFQRVSFHKIIFTKIDEAVCFGPILSLNCRIEQPITYITTGQNVPEDIEIAEPTKLARMIFGV
ncbi:TPA: flagellar biosynthesis protein FlhF [bacterium]|nr:flagellar biosynthesis protein FlhF [bacterium]